jgi:hypothetical protein
MRRTSFLIMLERSTNEQNKTRHYMYLSCLSIGMFHIPSCFRQRLTQTCYYSHMWYCSNNIFTFIQHEQHFYACYEYLWQVDAHTSVLNWMKTISSSRWFRKNARHRLVDGVNGYTKLNFSSHRLAKILFFKNKIIINK